MCTCFFCFWAQKVQENWISIRGTDVRRKNSVSHNPSIEAAAAAHIRPTQPTDDFMTLTTSNQQETLFFKFTLLFIDPLLAFLNE